MSVRKTIGAIATFIRLINNNFENAMGRVLMMKLSFAERMV